MLTDAQTICHTPQVSSQQLMKRYMLKSKSTNNSIYMLKVYFHVMRKSDGTGGHSSQDVYESFNILNRDFNSHGIYFIWNGNIDYIDDSSKYYYPNSNIFTYNNHQDGIDIYLFPDEVSEGYEGGLANGVGNSSELYVGGLYWKSPYPSLVTSHVVSHEMGHVLGLWHTHHGTMYEGGDASQCAELVDGSNSDTCGDYIEDTPADPHLNFNVNPITCQWLGTGIDANGDYYAPDTRLIMSYTDIRCMDYFSSKQGERMKDAVSTLSHLQSCIVSPYISGPSVVCDSAIYNINNLPAGATVSWTLTPDNNYTTDHITLQSDTLTPGVCTIHRTIPVPFKGVLSASVYYNGDSITTKSTRIIAHTPLGISFCIFEKIDGSSSEPYLPLTNGISKVLNANEPYYITSPNFCGMNFQIIHSSQGATFGRVSDNKIMVGVPAGGFLYVSVYGSGCNDFAISLTAQSNHSLNISNTDGMVNVSLQTVANETNPTLLIEEQSLSATDEEWTLEVLNIQTGRRMLMRNVSGNNTSFSTTGWESGIYVINARIGKETLSEIITIK